MANLVWEKGTSARLGIGGARNFRGCRREIPKSKSEQKHLPEFFLTNARCNWVGSSRILDFLAVSIGRTCTFLVCWEVGQHFSGPRKVTVHVCKVTVVTRNNSKLFIKNAF